MERRRTVVAKKSEPVAKDAKSASNKTPAKPVPKEPTGPLIIAVSIGSQRVNVYDNGSPIASAPISSGMKGHLTPMGVFSVIQKDRYHHSNLYSNAPMPYMQRITWSGVALHAGVLPGYPASHGCIRMPESFALRMWGMTHIGARVVVTRNDVAPYEINHPRLVALSTRPADPEPAAPPAPAPVASPSAAAPAAAPVVASTPVTPNAAKPGSGTTTLSTVSASTVSASTSGAGAVARIPAQPLIDGSGNPLAGVAKVEPVSLRSAAIPPLVPAPRVAPAPAPSEQSADLRPTLAMFAANEPVPIPSAKPTDAGVRAGAISLFVSRKTGKLYVRKGFEPMFDTPVTIARPEVPFGTHVFTAGRPTDGAPGLRWLAVSIPNERASDAEVSARPKSRGAREERPAAPSSDGLRRSASEALDRIDLPPDVLARITPYMAAGASLLISDQGLGEETGKETDFIVVTR